MRGVAPVRKQSPTQKVGDASLFPAMEHALAGDGRLAGHWSPHQPIGRPLVTSPWPLGNAVSMLFLLSCHLGAEPCSLSFPTRAPLGKGGASFMAVAGKAASIIANIASNVGTSTTRHW